MFRLTGTDLPTTKKDPVRVVPAFRVWQGASRGMGVLARINTYANYRTPGFDVQQIDIPRPLATGLLFKLMPPFAFKHPGLEGFQILSDAISPLPKTFWVGDGVINIYAPTQTLPSLIAIAWLVGAPLPGRALAVPNAFTPTTVTYQGLIVPFTLSDGQLSLDTSYAIPVGDELEIVGSYAATPQFISYAATFLFSEFDFLDRFDYMGVNYAPAPDATNPQVGQFVWSETLKLATVFSSTVIDTPAVNWDYSSSIGVLSY